MEETSVILSFRFKGNLPQIKAISFFTKLLNEWFGKSVEKLNYSITDKTKFNWKQKTKGVKFTENNLKQFEDIVLAKTDKIYIDFELLKNLNNSTNKSRDVDFSILYNLADSISAMNFVFNYSLYPNVNWIDFAKTITTFLNDQNCEVVYGFVLSLKNSKNPSLYIEGIGNYELGKSEEEKLNLWSNGKNECDKKIWDIFWGNIISISVFQDKRKALEDIEGIIGKNNSFLLTPSLIWFNLKEHILEFDIVKYTNIRRQLYDYFRNKDLVIK